MPKTTGQKVFITVIVLGLLTGAFFGFRWLFRKITGATASIDGDDVTISGTNGAPPVVLSKSEIWNAAANTAKQKTMEIKTQKDLNFRLGVSDRGKQTNAYMKSNIYPNLRKLVGMPAVKRNAVLAKIDQISESASWSDSVIKKAVEKNVELWMNILAGAIWQVNQNN